MVTDSPGFMICGGAGTRLGSRQSGSFTHGRVGLGPAQPSTKFPSSSALLLGLILMFIPGVSGVVCSTCQDTIHGCGGGADCPLLKTRSKIARGSGGEAAERRKARSDDACVGIPRIWIEMKNRLDHGINL